MKEKIKMLDNEKMEWAVKQILGKTNVLSGRFKGTLLEGLKLSELSNLDIMSLPEASVISYADQYYCNKKGLGLSDKENFEKIIESRKTFQGKEVNERLDRVLKTITPSLVGFIKKGVEAEHKVSISSEIIEELISQYKKTKEELVNPIKVSNIWLILAILFLIIASVLLSLEFMNTIYLSPILHYAFLFSLFEALLYPLKRFYNWLMK
jgi:hypothetical protein